MGKTDLSPPTPPSPSRGMWACSPAVSIIQIQKKSRGSLPAAGRLGVTVPNLLVKPLPFGSGKAQGQSKMYLVVDD